MSATGDPGEHDLRAQDLRARDLGGHDLGGHDLRGSECREADHEPLLRVEDLRVSYQGEGTEVKAVDGVSFALEQGATLGIVGESGSGKSTLALTLLGLTRGEGAEVSGRVLLEGRELLGADERELRAVRGDRVAMIFQEPLSSLHPMFRVGAQIVEAIKAHRDVNRRAARAQAIELLASVGIDEPRARVDAYPHELSGGQRQRAMIAMALSCDPDVLVADEPTSALDVTVQARILELLGRLRRERRMALVLVSHDLGVVAEMADEIAVMKDGHIVEQAAAEHILSAPEHPYTAGLLRAIEDLETPRAATASAVEGIDIPRAATASAIEDIETPRAAAASAVEGIDIPRAATASAVEGIDIPRAATASAVDEPLLQVSGLVKEFAPRRGVLRARGAEPVRAVDGVSFAVAAGETFGIVGESGSGKSTTARMIVRLIEPTSGEVRFAGQDIMALRGARLKQARRELQIVFQDPYSSLNPRRTIGAIVGEPLAIHGLAAGGGGARSGDEDSGAWSGGEDSGRSAPWAGLSRSARRARARAVAELLELVGLDAEHAARYPHELSGGQRQRVGIARALALRPRLLIADEPVSALDVTIQAQVLDLLCELQAKLGLTLVFISHDLSVIRHMCDRVAVMRKGLIVELAPGERLYRAPEDPYTKELLNAVPRVRRLSERTIPA